MPLSIGALIPINLLIEAGEFPCTKAGWLLVFAFMP